MILVNIVKSLFSENVLKNINKIFKIVTGLVILVGALSDFLDGLEKSISSIQFFISDNIKNKEPYDFENNEI